MDRYCDGCEIDLKFINSYNDRVSFCACMHMGSHRNFIAGSWEQLLLVCVKGSLTAAFYAYQGGDRLQKEKRKNVIEGIEQGTGGRRWQRFAITAYMIFCMLLFATVPVCAEDLFGIAKSAMQTVYTDVAGIATVAAVVCAAVCLLLMNFSKSGRTVDESRSWLKRIIICWAALMTLGAIVTYFEKIIPQNMFSV